MKHYESVIIGHISLDYNIDYLDKQIIEVGGAVTYSPAAAYALGHKVLAITKLAKQDIDRLGAIIIPKEDILCLPSSTSTSIRNKYFTADKERRECKCISQGDPFKLEEIPTDITADIYHLAGLIYGDFDGEIIKGLSKRGKVAVDVQAMLRHADKQTGAMYFEDWKDKKELLPYIHFFKTDAAEAEILTGQKDRITAAKQFIDWGCKEVCITHNTEVIAYDGKTLEKCPIKARNLEGRSGRGDTTFASYITERLHNDIKTSLLYATATVSAKMETPGPYRGTRADIEKYIEDFYK